MKLHYSQTILFSFIYAHTFYYLMKLHYSQTSGMTVLMLNTFYYLMKLHYSQTQCYMRSPTKWFYYLMKLHYSQTFGSGWYEQLFVLLPYEITLFSNVVKRSEPIMNVLLPYEITLFSNSSYPAQMLMWFYYLMKLHYSQTRFSRKKRH